MTSLASLTIGVPLYRILLSAQSGSNEEDVLATVRTLLLAETENKRRLVNMTDISGTTALYYAANKGFIDVCRLLIEQGADVNKATVKGVTPLMAACFDGRMDVVKLLCIEGYADIELRTTETIRNLRADISATSLANVAGHTDIVKFLMFDFPVLRKRWKLAWIMINQRAELQPALPEMVYEKVMELLL